VARVTAQYVQWSAEQQIAQSERTQSHQWQAYDRVIDRHRDKFSPEVARYMMRTVNHIKELEWKLGLAHGQLAERAARLEALERRLAELAAGQDSQTAELGALQQRNEVLGGELAAIKGSRAWQLVQRYGKWRQRLGLPGGHQ